MFTLLSRRKAFEKRFPNPPRAPVQMSKEIFFHSAQCKHLDHPPLIRQPRVNECVYKNQFTVKELESSTCAGHTSNVPSTLSNVSNISDYRNKSI